MASNNHSSHGTPKLPVNGKEAKDGGITAERLPSFRVPRDLTLGGMQLKGSAARPNLLNNKRVYTPNLNAVRNKNVDVKTSKDTTKPNLRGRGRGARTTNDRTNANAARGRNNVISSVGVFSQGAGDGVAKQLYRSFRGTHDEASTAAQLRRPTISSKREKFDPIAEKKKMAEIYDLDEDFDGNGGVESAIEEGYAPIILTEPKADIKIEDRLGDMNIKSEVSESAESQSSTKYPANIQEFFERTSPQFFLLQLPDSLPGHGADPEPGDSAETDQLNDSTQWNNLCTMNNVEEGQIGRLVRYRSGKTKLIINDTQFDVDLGIDPNHLQEILSIETDAERRTGDMVNVGQIGANLCAVPDWESIFSNSDAMS